MAVVARGTRAADDRGPQAGWRSTPVATALIFPTPGCWEVTGRVGQGSLTFVTQVGKIGEGPEGANLPDTPRNRSRDWLPAKSGGQPSAQLH
ncbi:MAG: hypothetical protein DMG06_16860 [Acidobacteria bacterium]|nr:MAG: hypothetical protein DMG06_16860 [Acidobacteriota bacterium]